ncbi:MAG: Molybdopterin oxidoreductase, Psr/Psh family, PsrB-like Fe-S subunit [Firmicutes bacterium]|nr:Molybdopterin oxidoreductase, Psr/Psh family, PsrB-like Fe-S subunit [Bacillota bacterium]
MAQEDILITMQADLDRAMKKSADQRRWGMLIDTRKCVGCHACTIGCVAEYKLPPGVVYRPVMEQMTGIFPAVKQQFIPRPCFQCENPSCVSVCPVGATKKEPDGIVSINYETCIGCRSCVAACPYGARTFDRGNDYTEGTAQKQPYEAAVFYEYDKAWRRDGHSSAVVGSARKCHFCTSRLTQGLLPVCVTTCIGRATYFGDLKDEQSLIRQTLKAGKPYRFKEETGNDPQVYYL